MNLPTWKLNISSIRVIVYFPKISSYQNFVGRISSDSNLTKLPTLSKKWMVGGYSELMGSELGMPSQQGSHEAMKGFNWNILGFHRGFFLQNPWGVRCSRDASTSTGGEPLPVFKRGGKTELSEMVLRNFEKLRVRVVRTNLIQFAAIVVFKVFCTGRNLFVAKSCARHPNVATKTVRNLASEI